MIRRSSFALLIVLVSAALAATACTKSSPAAPSTQAAVVASSDATAAGTTAGLPTTGLLAVARPGAVDVKGQIASIDLNAHTFVLDARSGKQVDVRVTQKTVFAAGPNPRARLTFRSLKAGMAVDVVGRVDQGVLVAVSVVVLKPRT